MPGAIGNRKARKIQPDVNLMNISMPKVNGLGGDPDHSCHILIIGLSMHDTQQYPAQIGFLKAVHAMGLRFMFLCWPVCVDSGKLSSILESL